MLPGVLPALLAAVLVATAAPSRAKSGEADSTGAPAESTYRPGPLLARFLDAELKDVEEIVFAVRVAGRDHWYVNFGNYSDHSRDPQNLGWKFEDGVYWGYGEGGRLCRLDLRSGKLTTLIDDPKGGVRDPQVHYDGKKILFSYRPGGTHVYHLYEIDVDGLNLRQLTDGPDDDIEPTYCPDGSIVFCSARCRRFVNCWLTRVATLYRCDADGGNIRMLSSNNDHDNTPWLLPDGRVLYMRWEYVDRSQVHYHHLWTMNPDGTGQMVYYGNLHGGIAMLDAKPIPGTGKVVSSFSPGHGSWEHQGHVTIVDPRGGPDDQGFARNVSARPEWRDPYALSENCFLVSHPRGLFVMDGQGQAELIYELPKADQHMQCHEPRPIMPRPRERVIPPRVDLGKSTGRVILQDIYQGRRMKGVPRGTVKKLLVLQQVPKPVNFSGGMEPLTIGGSFTLAELLGEVPVEDDGSAYLELPALSSLFFVALDAQDRPVKRMHSFLVLQPGETTSCVGCHEQRTETPVPIPRDRAALRKRPARIEPITDVPSVFDFPRDIQPILDRRCVECHNPDRREGGVDLCGDKTVMYTVSYETIHKLELVSDGRNRAQSNYAPYEIGSAASRLMTLADGSHHGATLSDHERKMVRLWIETSATYPGTYAALGCGAYPVHLPRAALNERCGQCHGKPVKDQYGERTVCSFRGGTSERPDLTCNLTRPEKSTILRGPLSRKAGGLEACGHVIFEDTADPLYQQVLAAIEDAARRLAEGKRFDMPGFRPNEHYIREMQRFGILPADLAPDAPIDPYATDRAYWESFHYRPANNVAVGP